MKEVYFECFFLGVSFLHLKTKKAEVNFRLLDNRGSWNCGIFKDIQDYEYKPLRACKGS